MPADKMAAAETTTDHQQIRNGPSRAAASLPPSRPRTAATIRASSG